MIIQVKNEHGFITVNESYIKQILLESIKPYEGKVWFAKYEGRQNDFQIALGQFDQLFKFTLETSENGSTAKIYIVVLFGSSLSSISTSIIKSVNEVLENDLALKVDNIIVYVTALISKKGIIKKDLLYKLHEQQQD